ncbi:MAG TPA: c-type cytochrome [Solirubrobacterales bacterium]|nr:c-type cytochrome [Solirubrobacterales bacterium]
MHETFFFICGGILAASAVVVSLFGLKSDNFPGKWMPLVIVWFAVFAIGTGTFAVLHGKDESKDHDKEYAKASEEIEKADTSGPFEEAELEKAKEAESGEGEAGEGSEGEEEGAEGEEGGEPEAAGGGDPEKGSIVFSENCSVCHGATGHGGNGGPDLTTMPLAQTEEGAIQQVTNGGGGMPPFGGTLSEEEIENVAAYVAQEITHGE